jgi:hypothetical protein
VRFVVIAAFWLGAAIALGASGVLQQLAPPGSQLVVAGLTGALLLAWRLSYGLRQWLAAIDSRALIALHLTRFIGIYFLVLCRRGELLCTFATPAGWGDILVATLAAVLLIGWNQITRSRVWIFAWNALGLLDILFVVASAARHTMADPGSMAPMLKLPLNLLLTFLVPLIIASHVLIFSRLSTKRGAAGL